MQITMRRASIVLTMTVLALAGCADSDPMPIPTTAPSPSASPSAEAPPELVEGGTAGQNRPYFDYVLTGIAERLPNAATNHITNRLIDAGFDREAMEATVSSTPAGYDADSILIAVRFGDQCLVASVAGSDVVTDLVDVLGSGTCLVGETVSID